MIPTFQTNEDELIIIEKGKPIDFFVLIVEGKVQASVGKEELVFESGPFSYYGLQVCMLFYSLQSKVGSRLERW